ncbi:hypothetical protein AAE478_003569 [Parahypoxylon ruwenzoriense]
MSTTHLFLEAFTATATLNDWSRHLELRSPNQSPLWIQPKWAIATPEAKVGTSRLIWAVKCVFLRGVAHHRPPPASVPKADCPQVDIVVLRSDMPPWGPPNALSKWGSTRSPGRERHAMPPDPGGIAA